MESRLEFNPGRIHTTWQIIQRPAISLLISTEGYFDWSSLYFYCNNYCSRPDSEQNHQNDLDEESHASSFSSTFPNSNLQSRMSNLQSTISNSQSRISNFDQESLIPKDLSQECLNANEK